MTGRHWSRLNTFVKERAEAFFAITVIYACVMLTLTLVAVWPARHVPPLTYASVEVLSPEVPVGAFLRLRFSVEKVRACDVITSQFIVDHEGTVEAILTPLSTFFGLGEQTRVINMRLPRDLEPGAYRYEAMFMHDCTNPRGSFLTLPEGDGAFTVVAP